MKYIKLITLALLINISAAAQQDTTLELSLNDAVKLGLEKNYQIQISDADFHIAKNNNTVGNAGMLPTVTAGIIQGNRYDNTQSQMMPDERDEILSNSLRPNANLQMILFNGFRIQITKRNLEISEELAAASLQSTIENTLSEIINSYYAVLLEKEKLKVIQKLFSLSKDRYDYIMIRKELGTAVTYDVLQVKNAFLQDSANVLRQKSAYDNAMRRLNVVMGDTSFSIFILTDTLKSQKQSYSLSELETLLPEHNSALLLSRMSKNLTENFVQIAKSSKYPSLALNAGSDYAKSWAKYNDTDYNDSYSYDFYANLSLSYTIFNGGNRKRQISNAKIEVDKANLKHKDLELTLKNSLYALYDMYEIRKQVLNISEENMETATLNLSLSKDRFNRGTINSFNYRDVQINYLNTAFSNLQAEYNLILVNTDLLKITGNLIGNLKN